MDSQQEEGISELNNFISEMQSCTKEKMCNGSDIRNDLIRWSIHEPYWCIFVCEHSSNAAIQIEVEGVVNIEGHYCIDHDVEFHEVLTLLTESGWKIEIHEEYYK